MAESPQNEDKWDIVILHSESQYKLALAVKKSIESVCSTVDPPVRVEVFEDLFDLGTTAIKAIDDIIENAGIVMFFRHEEFFSEQLYGFGLVAAVENRVNHEESRRHFTILPLDIGKKTRVLGKSTINQLCGLIVTADGHISEPDHQKMRKYVTKVRNAAAISAISGGDRGLRDQSIWNGGVSEQSIRDRRVMDEAIGEGQSQQLNEIAALVPDASVNMTPLATGDRTSNDPKFTTDNRTQGGTLLSRPQSVADSRSGMDGPTLQDGHTRHSGLTGRGPLSLQNDPDSCLGRNRPEMNPDDRNSSAAPTISVAGNRCATSMPGIHLPARHETQSGDGETQVNSIRGDENNSDLPHSVCVDNQSFTSRPPPSSQHNATEPEKPCHGEQSQPLQRQQQSQNSGPVHSQGNLVQSTQCTSDGALQHYWNQTVARPKTTDTNSALPPEQWTNQLPVSMGQEQSPTAAERQQAGLHNHLKSEIRNHGNNRTDSSDADLLEAIESLRNTCLTPPPSPSHDGDHCNMHGGPQFPDSSLYQNPAGSDMRTYEQVP